jgi:major membrane immunogen (membrane-anchored lipoprotein)
MNKKRKVLAICCALFLSACGSTPRSLILGKWEVESAIKMTAEFSRDGTAKLTMLGQTLQGTYRINSENELEWTMNGRTTKGKLNVTAAELELTDPEGRTIRYKRL